MIKAEAEWGALLPLNNGTNEVVQGLRVPVVTVDMSIVKLTALLDAMKGKASDNPIKKYRLSEYMNVPEVKWT